MEITQAPCSLAKKFEILFDSFPAHEGGPFSLTELSELTGLSINTLSRLKTGRIEDPRLSTLTTIAEIYDLSLDFFQCQTEADCQQFLHDELRRRSTVPQIAMRVRAMSEDVFAELSKMVAYIEHLQHDEPTEEIIEPDDVL